MARLARKDPDFHPPAVPISTESPRGSLIPKRRWFSIASDFNEVPNIILGGVVCGRGVGNLIWEVCYGALRENAKTVTVNLSRTESIDAYALEQLKATDALLRYRGGRLLLAEPAPIIRDACAASGLSECLDEPKDDLACVGGSRSGRE